MKQLSDLIGILIKCFIIQVNGNVLGEMYKKFDYTPKFLENVDVIVDGEFVEEKKLIDLKFRGSTNQRKIDVQESLKEHQLIQLKFGDEERYESLT